MSSISSPAAINDYDALNLRSIEISASTTDDEGNTTLDWDAAEERLNAFQEEFEAAEDPLTALDTLASTYSDDSATSASGGAYETVHRGQFESALWTNGSSENLTSQAIPPSFRGKTPITSSISKVPRAITATIWSIRRFVRKIIRSGLTA